MHAWLGVKLALGTSHMCWCTMALETDFWDTSSKYSKCDMSKCVLQVQCVSGLKASSTLCLSKVPLSHKCNSIATYHRKQCPCSTIQRK